MSIGKSSRYGKGDWNDDLDEWKLLSRDGKMNSDESNKEFQTAKEMKFSVEDVFQ